MIEDALATNSLHIIPSPDISTNSTQHYVIVSNEEHHISNDNDTREADAIEIEDCEEIEDDDSNVSNNDQEDNSDSAAPENMEDGAMTEMEVTNSDPIYATRPGMVSKSCDHVAKFPEIAHAQIGSGKGT